MSVRSAALPEPIDRLRAVANRFSSEDAARKAALLERCSDCSLEEPPELVAYHDCLLFLLAYPQSERLLAQAKSELQRVSEAARRIADGKNERKRRALCGTGIAWSESTFGFSYDVARWLTQEHRETADVEGAEEGALALQSVLKLSFPPIEQELLETEGLELLPFLAQAKGAAATSNLVWLLAQLDRLDASDRVRAHLFESMKLLIRVGARDSLLSRTAARGLPASVFFHTRDLLREVDALALIAAPLPAPRRLSLRERAQLIESARGPLCMLGRETDPISATQMDSVAYYDLERGVAIGLYSMQPERRFPIDTHVGFVLFKNAVPVAYGGGWPFVGTCKIGLNVFAPFRGGESAYLFCQVLRVYRGLFVAERFVVEPYQFGAGNREGLVSGAFWFYYRLGFRPVQAAQRALAQSEFERIETEKGYRAPLAAMRRLARSDLELPISNASERTRPYPDAGVLSMAVSEWIAGEFAGDRTVAETASLRRVTSALRTEIGVCWPAGEQHSFRTLCPLVALIADLADWSESERHTCTSLMRAKGSTNESRYVALAARHRRFRNALQRICDSA